VAKTLALYDWSVMRTSPSFCSPQEVVNKKPIRTKIILRRFIMN